ncbi:MAG: NUDIX hydrolase [Candidatus Kapaibacteriales bacterium]
MTNTSNLLKKRLKELLKAKLPGHFAHRKMAPMLGGELYRTFTPTATATKSAVLVLIFGQQVDSLRLLLTLRSSNLPSHGNQISFPGGHCEPDESIIETAIRECMEETGISIGNEDIIGTLSELFVPPSDTIIHPVVAYVESITVEAMNEDEVAEIFTAPLSFFIDSKNVQKELWNFKGRNVEVPLWRVHPQIPLWGATAMIIAELTELLQPLFNLSDLFN